MNSVLKRRLIQLEDSGTHVHLKETLHGIEKEGLRVHSSGALSLTPHPHQLGSSLTNGSVTTDFSESQLELITPVFPEPETAIDYLKTVHQFTYSHLGDELIWAGSMPCHIQDESSIPISDYGSSNMGKMKHIYRVGLQHRYGKMMQSIAGIHYNFSLSDKFWRAYQSQKKNKGSLNSFVSSSYFTLIRNFRRHSWLLLYLFGASPALSSSFMKGKDHNLQRLHKKTLFLPYSTSLRMSDLGYATNAQSSLDICFNHLTTYLKSLTKAIHTSYPAYEKIGVKVEGSYRQLSTTILQIENEYYSDIRPKRIARHEETPLQALENRGVEYVEVRNTDINPLLPLGMDIQQALFLDTFLISCLLMGDELLSPVECRKLSDNLRLVTTRGREPGLNLYTLTGEIDLKDAGVEIIRELESTATLLDQLHNTDKYSLSVKAQFTKIQDVALTPSAMVLTSLKESGLEYSEWILEKSKNHRNTLRNLNQNEATLSNLTQQAEESLIRQKQLEDSDTLEFDEFLKIHRTGKKVNSVELLPNDKNR
ncbi:MAG: glutamate--cysteine ligase [Desulforhopalus sp.]